MVATEVATGSEMPLVDTSVGTACFAALGARIPSICAATSACMAGITWLYVFIVSVMDECPRVSIMSLG